MEDAHRIIVIIEEPSRNPYEIWMLGALLLSGILFLLGATPNPRSVQAALPSFSQIMWNVQIITGSVVSLIGIFWKQPIASRTMQIAGHLWVATGALIYALVLYYFAGAQATMSGLIILGVAAAGLTRAIQLRRQVRHIFQKVREQNGAGTLDHINGGDSSTA